MWQPGNREPCLQMSGQLPNITCRGLFWMSWVLLELVIIILTIYGCRTRQHKIKDLKYFYNVEVHVGESSAFCGLLYIYNWMRVIWGHPVNPDWDFSEIGLVACRIQRVNLTRSNRLWSLCFLILQQCSLDLLTWHSQHYNREQKRCTKALWGTLTLSPIFFG
jgi:hypothetical protein